MDKKRLEREINNAIFEYQKGKLTANKFKKIMLYIKNYINSLEYFAEDSGEHNIILYYRIKKLENEIERLGKLLYLLKVDMITAVEMDKEIIDFVYDNEKDFKKINIDILWKTYVKLKKIKQLALLNNLSFEKMKTITDIKNLKTKLL